MEVFLVLAWIFRILAIIVVAYVILSWVAPYYSAIRPLHEGLEKIVHPILAPIRRVLPPVRLGTVGLDFSPFIALIILGVLSQIFASL